MRDDEVQAFLASMSYYHEAAHAAVARHFGLEAEVHMTPPAGAPADWGAAASHEPGTNWQNAMISLAGECVEEMSDTRLLEVGRKVGRVGVPEDGFTDDMKHALVSCMRETGGDVAKATELANDLLVETRGLVGELWSVITEIGRKKWEAR
jgi:hypothetical protein